MDLSSCMQIVNTISDADADELIRRVDDFIAAGYSPRDAQRTAVADWVAEVEQEQSELMAAIREQHPDLFEEPRSPPPRSQFFTNPDEFDGADVNDALRYARAPFYSALTRAIEALPAQRAPTQGWRDTVKGLVAKGAVKSDEVEWSGLNEWLSLQQGRVPKQAVLDYLEAGGVVIDEVVRDERPVPDDEALSPEDSARLNELMGRDKPVSQRVVTPEQAREIDALLDKKERSWNYEVNPKLFGHEDFKLPGDSENYRELLLTLPARGRMAGVDYSPNVHFPEANILAHLRVDERQDVDGKRVLLISELQSDWAIERRKGRQEAPDAPFIDATKWLPLALKRAIKLAADEGIDRVAWATGEQVRDFLSVGDSVNRVAFERDRGGKTWSVVASNFAAGRGDFVIKHWPDISQSDITKILGAENSARIVSGGEKGRLDIERRVVGGEPLLHLYDEVLPNVARDVLKKIGGNGLRSVTLMIDGKRSQQQGFDITPVMREHAAGDLPMFARLDDSASVAAIADAQRRAERAGSAASSAGARAEGARRPRSQRFTLSRFDAADRFIEAVQDRYNRWRATIAQVRAQGGTINEANDFYRAEERFHGKVGARLEDFQGEVEQFIKDVAADKLTLGDVATYAYAKHAAERNAYIAGIRPDMPDAGSGMTNADAQALIDDARNAGLAEALEKHAGMLKQWATGTRDFLRDEGLITAQEHAAWSAMFKDYVPLRGQAGRPAGSPAIGRFDIRGREAQHAKGRHSEAEHIIEQIVQDRMRALIRAGRNEVLRSFLAFVLDNPSPNLWQVNAVESRPVTRLDAFGDRVVEDEDRIVTDERTVAVKDGGQQVHILVRDDKLRDQLKNLNTEALPAWIGAMLWMQRLMGRMFTSLNPVFTVLNAARDVQAAAIGMTATPAGFKGAGTFALNLPGALKEAFAAEVLKKPSLDYQLYRTTGGKTGFFDFKTIDDQARELQGLIDRAERSAFDPREVGRSALDLVERLNASVENATRYAAFKAMRDSGASVAESANVAKNITVNFNRRGTATPYLSAWFLFFNPAVQGTTTMLRTMRSPNVWATLGAGMTGLFLLALQNADMGDDDDGVAWWDKIPSEIKERNIVIVLPPGMQSGQAVPGSKEGRYLKIPMPYGYNFFAVMAQQMADLCRRKTDPKRGRTPIEALVQSASALLRSWVPVDELGRSLEGSGTLWSFATPDFLKPFVQPFANRNDFGGPMYPDTPSARGMPDSSVYYPGQAGTIFQRGAEALNKATGGSKYRSGLIDVHPAQLENLLRSYGGGPATFTLDLINAFYVRQSIQRPDVDAKRLPFVRQLYATIDAETDRQLGYLRMRKIEEAADPFEAAVRAGDTTAARAMRAEEGPIVQMGAFVREQRRVLGELRKAELRVIDSDVADVEKYVKLRALDERKRKVLQRVNQAFDRVTVAASRQKKETVH